MLWSRAFTCNIFDMPQIQVWDKLQLSSAKQSKKLWWQDRRDRRNKAGEHLVSFFVLSCTVTQVSDWRGVSHCNQLVNSSVSIILGNKTLVMHLTGHKQQSIAFSLLKTVITYQYWLQSCKQPRMHYKLLGLSYWTQVETNATAYRQGFIYAGSTKSRVTVNT